jgi:hypothetical protein
MELAAAADMDHADSIAFSIFSEKSRSKGYQIFSYQKSKFGWICRGLGMELLVIFYNNILWPCDILYVNFGIFCGRLIYFSTFWYVVLRKIWQPWWKSFLLYVNVMALWAVLWNISHWFPAVDKPNPSIMRKHRLNHCVLIYLFVNKQKSKKKTVEILIKQRLFFAFFCVLAYMFTNRKVNM